jgi:sulfatase modifying factor 1
MSGHSKAPASGGAGCGSRGMVPKRHVRRIGRGPFEKTLAAIVTSGAIAMIIVAAGRKLRAFENVANTGALSTNVEPAPQEDAAPSPRFTEDASLSDSRMVPIPAGTYQPFYKVDVQTPPVLVSPFSLDEHPVTKREFLEFVRANPPWRKSAIARLFAEPMYLNDWPADLDPGLSLDEPVTFVSWFAARAFCDWTGKRLPTVAEWERVAGNAPPNLAEEVAAPGGSSRFQFAMGNSKPEMHGTRWPVFESIWEWTQDFNSSMVSGRVSEESAANLFCGAGVRAVDATDYGGFLRYSFRSSLKANYTLKNLGFRCAKTLQKTDH